MDDRIDRDRAIATSSTTSSGRHTPTTEMMIASTTTSARAFAPLANARTRRTTTTTRQFVKVSGFAPKRCVRLYTRDRAIDESRDTDDDATMEGMGRNE